MNTFSPELIVEATSVCDRACNGCYAPNVVSKEEAATLAKQNPALFLALKNLGLALSQLPATPRTISIRGGEPTRHPELVEILGQCATISQTVLETHGRWLMSDDSDSLLSAIQSHKVTVKLSFDSMHGTSADELKKMTSILKSRGIRFLVAITESSTEQFTATRILCDFIGDDLIIFQKKAESELELFVPKIGVIRTDGVLASSLSFKRSLSSSLFSNLKMKNLAGVGAILLGLGLVSDRCFAATTASQMGAPEPDGQLIEFTAVDAKPSVPLRGKLSLPKNSFAKKVPVVLLIAGSECDNGTVWVPRSETKSGKDEALFLQIRQIFLNSGIAVFSYTKRGCSAQHGGTQDLVIKKTSDRNNLLADNIAAFKILQKAKEIEPTKILVLGYSEGNDYAWELGLRFGREQIRGLLLLGLISGKYIASEYQQAVTRRIDEFDLADESHDGKLTKAELKKFPCFEAKDRFDLAESDADKDGVLTRLEFRTWREKRWMKYIVSVETAPHGEFVPHSKDPADLFKQHFQTPSMIETVEKQSVSVAIFQGGADNATPPHEAELLRTTLLEKNMPAVFTKIYPKLSHGFSEGTGYRQHCVKFGPIEEQVLNDLKDVALRMAK